MDNDFLNWIEKQNTREDVSHVDQPTSYGLLKKKVAATHELIKKYNDKLKECERLKQELDTLNKRMKEVTCNYNSSLAKVIKLELQNTEYKKKIDTLAAQVNEVTIKTAADQQHIQQLICKIKDIEGNQNDKIIQYDVEKSSLQVRIKELEQELKNVKRSYETKIKKIEKKVSIETENKEKLKDAGTNTTLSKDMVIQKPEVADKSMLTLEFYDIKDNPYPIFCNECKILLDPPPFKEICKVVSDSCPKLIEKISSPPRKLSSALEESTDINNEQQCKAKSLSTLIDKSSQESNQNSRLIFTSTNSLSPHTVPLNHINCNTFSSTSNSINQGNNHIFSTPINPSSMINSNTPNDNKNCESLMTIATSSISLISSLQKKIYALETKVKKMKKKLNKKNSNRNNTCKEHHQNVSMYDINNFMQTNFDELWRKMKGTYDRKERKNLDAHKRLKTLSDLTLQNAHTGSWKVDSIVENKQTSVKKKVKVKRKKLQNAHTNSWKVDSIVENKQTSVKKKPKKHKFVHSLFGQSDNSLNDTEDSEKLNSDFKADSSIDKFNDSEDCAESADSPIDKFNDSEDCAELADSPIDKFNDSEDCAESADSSIDKFNDVEDNVESQTISPASPFLNSNDTDVNKTKVEIVQNFVQRSKSIEGDSGILSEHESNKLMQLKETTDTSSELTEQKNTIERNSSIENEPCFSGHSKLVNKSMTKLAHASHLIKLNKPIEEKVISDTLSNLDEKTEKAEHADMSKTLPPSNLEAEIETNNSDILNSKKKRKLSESELKISGNRQKLLKKIRNLKRSSKIVKTCQNMLKQDISNDENEDSNMSEDQKDNNPEVVKEDYYISKKKPRIAHIPKNPIIKEMKLNNFEIQSVNDLENSMNEVDLNKSKDQICSNNEEKPQSMFSHFNNTEIEKPPLIFSHSNTENVENPVHEIPVSNNLLNNSENKTHRQNINTKFETNTNEYNQFDSISNINSVNETTEQDETKTDLNKYSEHFKHIDESNFLDVKEIRKTDNISEQKLLNFNDKSSIDTSKINNINERDLNTEEITHNNVCTKQEISTIQLESHCPLKMLQEYINKKPSIRNKKMYRKKLLHASQIGDKFVNKQLERLINSDWESSIHWDVIDKLKSNCNDRIIAKGIIEFLSTEQEYNKTLDKSYTPPAPLMTKAQQRIAPLLIDLEKSKPLVFQFVQAGIAYKLFKLNQTIERCVVQSLARMYTILARIKKDREKVRIFCCDALYCLGLHAILILYTVFTSWPEVFPNNETSVNKLLPKCMAHLIMTQQGTDYPKLQALKNLITLFYKYPLGTLSKNILQELLIALQERCDSEVETAIILLAKREGTAWTYTNIIRGALLSMIINNKLPSTYRAFSLLGNLLRVFPIEDKDNSVGEIAEQLCDLINSDEGSNEQKEGVISALLSLSRHKFDQVVQNTLKWTPSVLLRDRTIKQINGLFDTRDSDFWNSYLKKHRELFLAQENSNT
ncbi:putative leucine-rich repeat-containing protein DDB_G0290503 isoform X2 [Frieseomelitta varia]|uniref:putative leucine-rich repeat-containing protein DDB_G0290503 isoform X2 n=1 Tax=Frieseomelitta varia TaxID=561572 RepID=UPI001CB69409|nr:putative leucine-rich repeat-containing protein DDB_G0290503 isoform X2 [Frieseomelitta varia]